VALDDSQPLARVFAEMAERIATVVAPVIAMDGCSARMLEHVEAAVQAGTAPGPAGQAQSA
jgi:hypothetical protein